MKYFLLYFDQLGFENLAIDIANSSDSPSSLTSDEVRLSYKKRVKSTIRNLKKKYPNIISVVMSLDSWMIYFDDYSKVLESIRDLLQTRLPFEIILGFKEYAVPQWNLKSLEMKDETISLIKEDLISIYRSRKKEQNILIRESFILITEETFDHVEYPEKCINALFDFESGDSFYAVKLDKIKDFLQFNPAHNGSENSLNFEKYYEGITKGTFFPIFSDIYTNLTVQEKSIIPIYVRQSQDEADKWGKKYGILEFVKNHNTIILYGDPGSGKTTTLRWLAYSYIVQCSHNRSSGYIPIYIDLSAYDTGSFESNIQLRLLEFEISEPTFQELLHQKSLIFLIDGLDLISHIDDYNPYAEILNFIIKNLKNDKGIPHKYIISSRPDFFGPFLSKKQFSFAELKELSDPDILNFLEIYGKQIKEPSFIPVLYSQIKASDDLFSISRNPLMLLLIFSVAKRSLLRNHHELLPSNRAKLYEEFISGVFSHTETKLKRIRDRKNIEDFLADFYFSLQCQNMVASNDHFAIEIAKKYITHTKKSPGNLLDDIELIGLIRKDQKKVSYGYHQSFMEYFAAIRLVEMYKGGKNIAPVFSHPRWENVILFAAGIIDDSDKFDDPDKFVSNIIEADEIYLAAKCAPYISDQIKVKIREKLEFRLKYPKRYKNTDIISSLGRLGDIALDDLILFLKKDDSDIGWGAAQALGTIRSELSYNSLIPLLKDNDSGIRWRVIDTLLAIDRERSFVTLTPLLKDDDSGIRWRVAEILSKIDPKHSYSLLILLLQDDNPEVRWRVAEILSKIDPKHSYDLLILLLQDDNSEVREKVVNIINTLDQERSYDTLIPLLNDKDSAIRWRVAEILLKIDQGRSYDNLIPLLNDKDSVIRWRVANILSKIDRERSYNILNPLLKDDDPVVRWKVAEILSKIDPECSYNTLTPLLKDDDPDVRWKIAEFIIKINPKCAVNVLIPLLKDDDSIVRLKVVQAFGTVSSEGIVDALIPLLKDDYMDVRWKAADVIYNCNPKGAVDAFIPLLKDDDFTIRCMAIDILHKINPKSAVDALISLLKDDDSTIRCMAVDIVNKIDPESAVDALIPLLKDRDSRVRWTVADALGTIGAVGAVNALIPLLKDRDSKVRWSVANALGTIGAVGAVDALIPLLKDKNSRVRWNVVDALRVIGSEEAVDALIPLIKDNNSVIRLKAAETLGAIGSKSAVDSLISILKDEESDLRWWVMKVYLVSIKSNHVVDSLIPLLKDDNFDVRLRVADALGAFGSEEAVDVLIPLLKDKNIIVRQKTIDSLCTIGSERAVDFLIPLLKDDDSVVRLKVVQALGAIGSERAVDSLIPLLRDDDSNVRRKTVNALMDFGSERVVDFLIPLLKDEDSVVRLKVVQTLGGIGSEGVVDALIPLLKDDDSNVRRAVDGVLSSLASFKNIALFENLIQSKDDFVADLGYQIFTKIRRDEIINKEFFYEDFNLTQSSENRTEYFGEVPLPRVEHIFLGKRTKTAIRCCIVQLDYSLKEALNPFGYYLDEPESLKRKIFSALSVARKNDVDLICFPELSFQYDWIKDVCDSAGSMIVVGGTYYRDGYNECSLIINGKSVQPIYKKYQPSVDERGIIYGKEMRRGDIVYVYETPCGIISILTCIDYATLSHHVIGHSKDPIDIIINPCYDSNIRRFQQQCNVDCTNEELSVIQINRADKSNKFGKSCLFSKEHSSIIERFQGMCFRDEGDEEYLLVKAQGEEMIVFNLNLAMKAPPVALPLNYKPRVSIISRSNYDNMVNDWVSVEIGKIDPKKASNYPSVVLKENLPIHPRTLAKIWSVPFNRKQNFTGRKKILEEIERIINNEDESTKIITVSGLAGIGKTRILVEYAYQQSYNYDIIWWIRADSDETIVVSFFDLANRMGYHPSSQDPIQKFQEIRNNIGNNEKVLLIFDNVRNPNEIEGFIPPSSSVHILISTINPIGRELSIVIPIPIFSREESTEYIIKRTGEKDPIVVNKLAEILGDLPIALSQASAYIESNGISIFEYIERYQTHDIKMLERGFAQDYNGSIVKTWSISVTNISKESQICFDFLILFAFLGSECINLDILKTNCDLLPDNLKGVFLNTLDFDDVIELLRRYSLIERKDGIISIHRLVQLFIRESLDSENQKYWSEISISIINTEFPREIRKKEDRLAAYQLLPHALAILEYFKKISASKKERIELYNKLGVFFEDVGDYNKAFRLFEKAFILAKDYLSPYDPMFFRIVNNYAVLVKTTGDTERLYKFIECLSKNLGVQTEKMGHSHPEVAVTHTAIGYLLYNVGGETNNKLAMEHFQTSYLINKELPDEFGWKVASDLNNMATIYSDQGGKENLLKCEIFYQEALEKDKSSIFGTNHPIYAIHLHNYAINHSLLGIENRNSVFCNESLLMIQKAYDIISKHYSDDHPKTKLILKHLYEIQLLCETFNEQVN